MEHDEAVMLEAAMFGGVPEGIGYHFPHASHRMMQNGLHGDVGPNPWSIPRPPSPSLTAQRLIREQQVMLCILEWWLVFQLVLEYNHMVAFFIAG